MLHHHVSRRRFFTEGKYQSCKTKKFSIHSIYQNSTKPTKSVNPTIPKWAGHRSISDSTAARNWIRRPFARFAQEAHPT
jgi:hypothetical protein